MAGGGQGAGYAQGTSAAVQDTSRPGGTAMTPMGGASDAYLQNVYAAKQASGDIGRGQSGGQFAPPGYADGGMIQNPYNNFASPNQNFMQYPQQGQPNQAQQPAPLTDMPPPVQSQSSPDNGGSYAPANMGYDGSGSDAGIGGQPVNQMQSPVQWQGNKPPSMAQFRPQQGLQIQGNPTSQTVQRPQQR